MNEKQARIKLIKAIQDLVGASMGWPEEKAKLWMSTPNPSLGNAIPSNLVMLGKTHKLIAFIEAAIDENGPYTK